VNHPKQTGVAVFVRAYLRASTDEQDATRARNQLETFASDHRLRIASWYVENESGAKLDRPELFRLLADARPGDILLTEQVDRLSRLTSGDWERLKRELSRRQIRIVALDLPTSWVMAARKIDDFTSRMFDAINGMMLDVLAAVARKDYEDRRRRQTQGQAKAKAEGRYKGRRENVARNAGIASMLRAGSSWSQIQAVTGCSRATIAKIAKRATTPAEHRAQVLSRAHVQ
jgi:DNA invertase Pin-like site-specific DNA recombinase